MIPGESVSWSGQPATDYEKPEALDPQIFTGGPQLDGEATLHGYEDPSPPGDTKKFRAESLWRVLDERHINMIAFSGTIGNGLFLGSGRSLASAGPGGAVLCYILMGTVIASVISCLGKNDCVDVGQRPCHGISPPFHESWCRICCWVGLLVGIS
ncbi:uncharacterized protein PODANS_5_5340 [Podospora anserina S mat+]|uniref:Podospora anserina S mat+ genomic DNA chromosome 5, supercontig 6 n=1 Tax=Podospora anserina (strain S / ATCC MYA-4624 / DSM 980 / FGSC 10383) TaxID=515849 RepID=B2VL92_PODAN|nr:uncharacterized protein PODANS_5_5340 [Podospora anserina S mat+]CAP49208.1 unnamed protein product [Podospora anserina S mat+]CDP29512.1 Putative protein of unknown function [Podospora anserina S mat+]